MGPWSQTKAEENRQKPGYHWYFSVLPAEISYLQILLAVVRWLAD